MAKRKTPKKTAPPKTPKKAAGKTVETLVHEEASRKNIPTAEYQSMIEHEQRGPVRVAYERRNRDLDPQLVWRGKDEQDWSDLVVHAPPLYIQEKIHPKALIDDLARRQAQAQDKPSETQLDLFADFNGVPDGDARTEFYRHDANWSNRLILGDSLQVMASLAEREGLRGQVQCIYIDPPYGIKFNSNFQWSTTSRDVKDGNTDHITREPEQVKAFRDTWRDGIHSYLSYLRDRFTVARELLSQSGTIVVQIGDENVHRVRALMDEVFGDDNAIALVAFAKTSGSTREFLGGSFDYLLFYARSKEHLKFRAIHRLKELGGPGASGYTFVQDDSGRVRPIGRSDAAYIAAGDLRVLARDNLTAQSIGRDKGEGSASWFRVDHDGASFVPSEKGRWKTNEEGMRRLGRARRLAAAGNTLRYVRFFDDFSAFPLADFWSDTTVAGFTANKQYIVETSTKVVERFLLMTTDPGDLVLDPTCGSGTTAYVAEQWGRRWITIDTSRVALALARARIMGARYPYYLLADSREGQRKEAEVTRAAPSTAPTRGDLRQGFVYERVPHVTLRSIAHNAEIDVIWEKFQRQLEPLREELNKTIKQNWQEWEIPRAADDKWPAKAKTAHAKWWQSRVARQKEIDASIAAKAEFEYLYDKPYEDKSKVRVAGPFTVESISPHRVLAVGEDDELLDPRAMRDGPGGASSDGGDEADFAAMILENLRAAGVQQAHKEDKISFSSLAAWPGRLICAEGRFIEQNSAAGDGEPTAGKERRAAVFIGPEFGTVSRQDLVEAAREAADANFDLLIACAFNYEAHAAEFNKLGRILVLKARMNADLHMADELKNTGKGNLFVIFGEPDIEVLAAAAGQIQVKIKGVDVFHPNTGEVRSDGPDAIACWFIDSDYNQESFFVRQAYFLGANDPYKALKTTLRAEIDADLWATLRSDLSRPFDKPAGGRIAVKVINHLGDEVMKVFRVE
ncbi:MAG TPA: site-specific DNA-methyltransferase [Pirellulales bacterium]